MSEMLSKKILRAKRGIARMGAMGEDLRSSMMGVDKRTV